MTDAASLSNNAKGKSLEQIYHTIDSLNARYDSVGRSYLADASVRYYRIPSVSKADSANAIKKADAKGYEIDTLFNRLPQDQKIRVINSALSDIRQASSDLDFKSMMTGDADQIIRLHKIEAINKFMLALSCLIFFFIGAPLGAIIRKEDSVSRL